MPESLICLTLYQSHLVIALEFKKVVCPVMILNFLVCQKWHPFIEIQIIFTQVQTRPNKNSFLRGILQVGIIIIHTAKFSYLTTGVNCILSSLANGKIAKSFVLSIVHLTSKLTKRRGG